MKNTLVDKKKRAAGLSIISNTVLILLKFVAGFMSGSIGIISEAVHSGSDLFASVITYFSVNESSKPADSKHEFGHGKFEDFTSFLEGLLIILAAFYITYEAMKKILFVHTYEINVDIGLWVMGFSIIVNWIVSSYLFKVAKESSSIALYADGEHLRTDIYSSLAVFIGLFFVKFTGNTIFDSIIAVLVSVIIFIAGYKICDRAASNLLDTSLCDEDKSEIENIVEKYKDHKIISLKSLRTRKSGIKKNIELILVVDSEMTIGASHALCDEIEAEIESKLHNTDVTIHLEPN